MAEVVETFPEPTRGRDSRWAPYLDGKVWKLERGVDFPENTTHGNIYTSVNSAARTRGKTVKISHKGGFLYIVATDLETSK